MTRQLASELLKLRTTRGLLWIVLATAVLVVLPVVSVIASDAADILAAFDEQRQIVRVAALADVFALLLGITAVSGELGQGTITHTFLVNPIRERVLAAKATVAGALGLLLAAAALGLVLVIAAPWLSSKGIDLHLDDAQLQRVMLGIVLAGGLAAILGVGWGAVFRSQGPAITTALVYLLIGENILGAALGDNREYTPGAAFAAVVSGATSRDPGDDLLTMWPGLLLACAYTAGFLAIGTLVLSRRDV